MVPDVDDPIRELEQILDRQQPIDAINALIGATLSPRRDDSPGAASTIAVGVDSSALLRLADRSRTDVVDFLASRHTGPLILPGQVIQEFWNNTLAVIETHGESVRKKYLALIDEIRKLGVEFRPFAERFQLVLDEFSGENAFAFEPATAIRVNSVLEALQRRASVPYVPRARFRAIADIRDKTRTPPGFRDPGQHGDFFVWADYLLGLMTAERAKEHFDLAILVTADEKVDWSRGGRAHPLLVAEVNALVHVPFETWNLGRLARYVATQTAVDAPPADATLLEVAGVVDGSGSVS